MNTVIRRRQGGRTVALCTLVCSLILGVQPGWSHQKLGARKALVTAKWDGQAPLLEVMVFLRISGPRAQSFMARYDLDGSGSFEEAESRLLGDALGPLAIGGLQVLQGDATMVPRQAQAKGRLGPDQAVEVAVLLSFPGRAKGPLTFEIRDLDPRGPSPHGPIFVEFAALAPLHIKAASSAVHQGVVGPFKLSPKGQGLEVSLARGTQPAKALDLPRDP